MNIFDSIGKTTFDIMRANFGFAANWKPSNSGPEVNKEVLYQAPTGKFELNENDFELELFKMEYYETDFPGLYESVMERENELVTIEVSKAVFQKFIVKNAKKKGDGKTVIARLTPIE